MIEDSDADGGIAVVLAIAIALFIALFAIGIAVFLSSEPPLRAGAAGAPAARSV
jgi:hypothetical protein